MSCLNTAKILFPSSEIDIAKWAVVACDQYTSQPEYWEDVLDIVRDVPSSFHITLPEIYLEDDDVGEKTDGIHKNMSDYINQGKLIELPEGLMLVERYSGGEHPRRGIVLEIDLESYDFNKNSASPIRPTEKTIVERIPPRLKVRQNADVELPHVMLIIDDPAQKIIEPLFEQTSDFKCVYDVDLMQKGGHISGYLIEKGNKTDDILADLNSLFDEQVFAEKYKLEQGKYPVLPFAVGDGNHSLATAKSHWLEIKATLTADEQENHPARFCLVEIVNIHEPCLIIEPIHRVMFDTNVKDLLEHAIEFFANHGSETEICDTYPQDVQNTHIFPFYTKEDSKFLLVKNPKWAIAIATLQTFLDDYLEKNKACRIDYIHGADVTESLANAENTIGFILPDLEKGDIFKGVILDDVLPRKTFSMGEAHEKRYYMEARKITV
ncbi:MAG: DUF1015 domain-containing protein [Clostridia bacterium]